MSLITLPGLIDPHVHLRDPGQTDKEDFYTGTKAALAGGFTTILDMPNNKIPITNIDSLNQKIEIAKDKIVCDVGFFLGSVGDKGEELDRVKDFVFGLKLYLNITTGHFIIDKKALDQIFEIWNSSLPILVHAEEDMVNTVILEVKRTGQSAHVCHISSKNELEQIIKAKEDNLPITCGVTPHHLFLTEDDLETLKSFGLVKPSLKSVQDVEFLWSKLNYIDCVESDHAPHTISEKESNDPPSGVPGLETTLPLLLTAYNNDRLTVEDITRLCFEGPSEIFHIPADNSTRIEIDTDKSYIIDNKSLHTKCKWSPFDGWEIKGGVERVFLRNEIVFEKNEILAEAGSGRILKPQ